MAGQADGSIIIDTELDSEGFEAGSDRLESAIMSFGKTVAKIGQSLNSLGPTFARALQGNESSINSFNSKIGQIDASLEAARHKILELEDQLNSLGNAQIPTQEYSQLSTQLTELDTKLYDLIAKQRALDDAGVGKIAEQYNSIKAEISQYEAKIAEVKQLQAELRESGAPTWSTQYQEANQVINELNLRISNLKTELQGLEGKGSTGAKLAEYQNLTAQIEALGASAEQTAAQMAAMEQDGTAFTAGSKTERYAQLEAELSRLRAEYERNSAAASDMKAQLANTDSEINTTERDTDKLSRTTRRLQSDMSKAGSVGSRAFAAIRDKVKAAASSMLSFLTHSKATKNQFSGLISSAKKFTLSLLGARGVYALLRKAVSAYMSENEDLKNTLDSCWSSIGNILGPIITKLINLVATATAYVTSFLKLFNWFGKSTQKSISKANDDAQELKRTLASFDDLNILSFKSDSSKDNTNTDSKSELADVDLPDWARLVAEQIKAGNWYGAANILADQLNSMIDSLDWKGYGTKIGKLFNGVLGFIATFIKAFDWVNLGSKLGTFFTNLIKNIDWSHLGTILMARWSIPLQLLVGFFENFDGATLGNGLHQLFTGIITAVNWVDLCGRLGAAISKVITDINWKQLGSDIATLFRTALQSLAAFVSKVDWKAIGESVADFLINSPDWKGVFDDLGALIGGLFIAAIDLLSGFLGKVEWDQLARDIGDWFTELPDKISLSGFGEKLGTLIGNALNGVLTFLITLLTEYDWGEIIFNIFDAVGEATGQAIDAIDWKEILGKLVAAIAGMLLQIPGMLLGQIGGILSAIGSFFESIGLESVGGFFKGIGEQMKNIGSWLKENLVDPVVNWVKNLFGIHSPSTVFAEIGEYLIQGLLGGIKAVWGSITGFFSEKLNNIKTGFSNAWSSIKSGTSTAWSSIKSTLSSHWNSIKSTASSTWSGLKSTISSKWNDIKSNATSTWNNIKSTLSSNWDSLKSTASSKFGAIISTISNKGWYGVGSNICNGIRNGINSGWNWLTTTVGNLANSLLTSAKNALGIHSPSKLFRDQVGKYIGYGIGEGINDSESYVMKSVHGIADAIADESAFKIPSIQYAESSVVSGLDNVTGKLSNIAAIFQSITEMLNSIGGLKVPQIATGTVVPIASRVDYDYATAGTTGLSTDFTDGVDEQLYDVVELLKQILELVRAKNLNIDLKALADMITKQQRDKTRNFGGEL